MAVRVLSAVGLVQMVAIACLLQSLPKAAVVAPQPSKA